MWVTTPIQKFLQRRGNQEPLMSSDQVEMCYKLIQDGDIVLSYEQGRPTSVLIKGFWDHATIVTIRKTIMEAVGDKFIYLEDYSFFEILFDWIGALFGVPSKLKRRNIGGVREVSLREWLFKKDSVCVIRPIYKKSVRKKDINKNASGRALGYKGLDYDYQFTIGAEKVYCSELVYLCYAAFDADFMSHIDGEILPIDYYNMCFDSPRKDLFFKVVVEVRN